MKITIALGAFLPVPPIMGGAVEKAWFLLAEEFAGRGHEVTIVSRAIPQFEREETLRGVRHLRVKGYNSPRSPIWLKCLDLFYSLRVKAILPAGDVLVTNTFWLPILVRKPAVGRLYVHVARLPKKQLFLYRHTARLQVPSRAVARAIREQAPDLVSKTVVIPYPAPISLLPDPPPSLKQRRKVILYVGRVHPEKGVHLLVSGFSKEARTLFADWELMIVGPVEEKFGGGGESYLAALRTSAAAASSQVTLAGPIFDATELERTLRSARLFVYPSLADRGESFGLAPLEAMSQGCAVLVSNLECFRDFIEEGITGFVFDRDPANAEHALTSELERAIRDETVLARVARAGYEKSMEYSRRAVADLFLQDFQRVIQEQ